MGAAVEDDKGAVGEAGAGEVAVELFEAGGEGVGFFVGPDFEFDAFALPGAIGEGPADHEVDGAAADAIFAIDEAASVDDALEECHEHELGGDFVVVEAGGDGFAVLGPPVGEGFEEGAEVEVAVRGDEAAGAGEVFLFDAGGEFAGDDFAVDGVGDSEFGVGDDEAEVAGVVEVFAEGGAGSGGAGEEGFDDAADAGFAEAGEEAVDVGGAGADEAGGGGFDFGGADLGGVGMGGEVAAEGVDEPGLAGGEAGDGIDGFGGVLGAVVGGVLGVEGGDLFAGEVMEAEGAGFDVEGTAGSEVGGVAAGGHFVISDVAEAAEGDGPGGVVGAVGVVVAELGEHGDEGVADEDVDFVEEEDEGAGGSLAPGGEAG